MGALAKEAAAGRPNMVALGILPHWLGFCPNEAGRLIDHVFHAMADALDDDAFAAHLAAVRDLFGDAVERDGQYEISLRRWPLEADAAITGGLK